MGRFLRHMLQLILLLIILMKEPNMLTADCSCTSSSPCSCSNQGITNVPQSLPASITSLDLRNNQIKTLTKSELSRYKTLTELDFGENRIGNVYSFPNLPMLKVLHLQHNMIAKIDRRAFENLPQLHRLNLSNNQITKVLSGTFAKLPRLKTLSLSFNKISVVKPFAFAKLRRLNLLHLSSNMITVIPPATFSDLLYLKTLSMSYNQIIDIPPATFSTVPRLEYLHLHSNKITNVQKRTFSNLRMLEVLYLNSNHITNIGPRAFFKLPKLRHLRLDSNKITTIQPSVFLNLPGLKKLSLSSNQMTVLPRSFYDMFASISSIGIIKNPWQCDCKMIDFRKKMTGSAKFENQIECVQPANLFGHKLKDVNPEDLMCNEATTAPFSRLSTGPVSTSTAVNKTGSMSNPPLRYLGATVDCQASFASSMVSKPPLFIFTKGPQGPTAIRVSPTYAPFSTETESKVPDGNIPHESTPSSSLLVVTGSVSGSVASLSIVIAIVIMRWWWLRPGNPPQGPINAASVGASDHNSTEQGQDNVLDRTTKGSLLANRITRCKDPNVVISNKNATANVMTVGNDQTGQVQGQSQAHSLAEATLDVTNLTYNTRPTVSQLKGIHAGVEQMSENLTYGGAGPGQISEKINPGPIETVAKSSADENPSYLTVRAALKPNVVYEDVDLHPCSKSRSNKS